MLYVDSWSLELIFAFKQQRILLWLVLRLSPYMMWEMLKCRTYQAISFLLRMTLEGTGLLLVLQSFKNLTTLFLYLL
jgi:hypothetical protein